MGNQGGTADRSQLRLGGRALAGCALGVALLAVSVRLAAVLAGGGLGGLMGYDDGVYYAGAAAMISGRLPYRDFVLLHPPGILLALAPFAEIGRLTSDSTGLAVARLAFMVVGGINAALVLRLAWRFGVLAAVVGGGFYALWTPAIYSEHTTLLEPLAGTALLASVLLLDSGRRHRDRAAVLAGLALGAACTLKIWYVAPALVVVVWQLAAEGRRRALQVVAGAALSVIAVCAPFLALAPSEMTRMVVLHQLGRPPRISSRLDRLVSMAAVSAPGTAGRVQVVLVGLLFTLAAVIAVRTAGARLFAALLTVNSVVLLVSPSYFAHYAVFVAAPLALTIAVAVGVTAADAPLPGRHGPLLRRACAVLMCAAVLVTLLVTRLTHGYGSPLPQHFRAAVSSSRCVVSDEPATLALLDVLSRNLERGCQLPVDLTGMTYGLAALRGPDGTAVRRSRNPVWQRELRGYLTSGETLVLTRQSGTGIGPGLRRLIRRMPVVASGAGLEVRAVRPPAP